METGPLQQPGKHLPSNVRAALDRLHEKHPEALEARRKREELAHGPRPRVLRPLLHVPVTPPVTPRTEVDQLELIADEDGHWKKK